MRVWTLTQPMVMLSRLLLTSVAAPAEGERPATPAGDPADHPEDTFAASAPEEHPLARTARGAVIAGLAAGSATLLGVVLLGSTALFGFGALFMAWFSVPCALLVLPALGAGVGSAGFLVRPGHALVIAAGIGAIHGAYQLFVALPVTLAAAPAGALVTQGLLRGAPTLDVGVIGGRPRAHPAHGRFADGGPRVGGGRRRERSG